MATNKFRFKKANLSLELILSSALGLCVLFLVLGLFGNNLKDMFDHGNMNNLFNNKAEATSYSKWGKNYSNSQVEVAVVAEQGLSAYHDNAQKTIESLAKLPVLTDEQKISLAEALTVYGESGSKAPDEEISQYNNLKNSNQIKIDFGNCTTRVLSIDKKYNWSNDNSSLNYNSNNEKARIQNVIAIHAKFKNS